MKILICLLPMMALAMGAPPGEDSAAALSRANNQFSAKMFNEVAKNGKGKSVVMSAYSALSPLAQLALASEGESHDEILQTIGLPNDEVTKEAFSSMNKNLRSVKGVELKVANTVYIAEGRELNEDFAKMSRETFDSDVKNVNFAKNVAAAATINGWVEENTNNRIKDLVDPETLNENTRAVLVNAIFFKGKWSKPFSKHATRDRDFHVTKEKTVQVPTMFKNGKFQYGESSDLDAKLLELPYEGGEASLLIVLPNKVDGIEDLQKKLQDPSNLARATQQMTREEVDVYLPKFKIETTIDLKDVLQKIGVTKLFSRSANLTKLLKAEGSHVEPLYISDAIQKAFIEVNEEGTEAAAASAYGIVFLSASFPEKEPIQFKADHPFIFYLKDNENPLFTGALHQ